MPSFDFGQEGEREGHARTQHARDPSLSFQQTPDLPLPYVGLMVSIFCCENQVDVVTLKILNAKKTKCTVTEASLNVLRGVSFPRSRLWTSCKVH